MRHASAALPIETPKRQSCSYPVECKMASLGRVLLACNHPHF